MNKSTGHRLFLLSFGIFQLSAATSLSMSTFGLNLVVQTLSTALRVVAIALALFKFVFVDLKQIWSLPHRYMHLAGMLALFFTLVAGYYYSRNIVLLYAFVFIVAAIGVNFRFAVKWSLVMNVGMVLLIVGSCLLNLIPDWTYERANGTLRHSLGFIYPSSFSSMLFYGTCMFLYLMRAKLKIFHVATLLAINFLVYKITDARAALFLIILLVVSAYALRYCHGKNLRIKSAPGVLLASFFALAAILTIWLTAVYDPNHNALETINRALSGRLRYGHLAVENYGIHPLGSAITWIGHGGEGYIFVNEDKYNYVDCSYVKILLESGVIPFLLVLSAYTASMVRAIRRKDIFLCLMLLFIAGYSAIEPRLMEIRYNTFIFTFAALFPFGCVRGPDDNETADMGCGRTLRSMTIGRPAGAQRRKKSA